MLKELYFRDASDRRYDKTQLETNSDLETLLNKIRLIMFTSRGEVLGFPEFGIDLESMLFDFDLNEGLIRDRFYAQIAKYVPERQFKIDIEFEKQTNNYENLFYIYITIDGKRVFGVTN